MTAILACMWLLMLVTFSVPGREGASSLASLDWIALLKVATRALVAVTLIGLVLIHRRPAQRRLVRRLLWPLATFVAWATLSTLWSPLPALTLGQASTTGVLVLLAAAIALEWRSPADTARVLRHLVTACLAVSSVLLAVHAVDGTWSGLSRSAEEGGGAGLMHPTSAGATASLGLVATVAVASIWRWPHTRAVLVPAALVHAAVMLTALSRTGLGMAALMLAVLALWRGHRLTLAASTIAVATGLIAYAVIDPRFGLARDVLASSAEYLRRGESIETLQTLTGRTELWGVVWESMLQSPVVGYGYHVTTADGVLDVWGRPAFRTAHNLPLHILASTGLVGAGLFVFGLARPWRGAAASLRRSAEGRHLRALLAVVGGWYLGWSLLSESFMGPLQPESVCFFALLGVVVGQAGDRA